MIDVPGVPASRAFRPPRTIAGPPLTGAVSPRRAHRPAATKTRGRG